MRKLRLIYKIRIAAFIIVAVNIYFIPLNICVIEKDGGLGIFPLPHVVILSVHLFLIPAMLSFKQKNSKLLLWINIAGCVWSYILFVFAMGWNDI